MKWEEARLSDNVEIAQEEPRPYGNAQVTRNVKTGAVSAIDPLELNIQCPITLRHEFRNAALRNNALQRESGPTQHGLIDVIKKTEEPDAIESLQVYKLSPKPAEPFECKNRAELFRQEFEQSSLGVRMLGARLTRNEQGQLDFNQADNHFWAAPAPPPGPGK